MAKGSTSEAPAYPTVTNSSGGLFGDSTTSASGSSFTPTDFQKNFVSTAEQGAQRSLAEYLNPDYNSEAFRQGDAYYTGKMNTKLQNDYLNPALSRGLLRGSTAMDVARGFANDLAATEYERQQDYKNQQLNNLQAALLGYNNIYDIYKGNTGLSQNLANSVASYNMDKYKTDAALQANQGVGIGSLLGSVMPFGIQTALNKFGGSSSAGANAGTSMANSLAGNNPNQDYGIFGNAANAYINL